MRASRTSACSRNPGPESALELLPSSALSSVQVPKAYPQIAALENRTFHLLFNPDILTCYQHGYFSVVYRPNSCGRSFGGGICQRKIVSSNTLRVFRLPESRTNEGLTPSIAAIVT